MELRKRRSKSENTRRLVAEKSDGQRAPPTVPKQHNGKSETVRTPKYTTGRAGGGADGDSINTEDAVVGAAVRGGSLLMLLAIIQVRVGIFRSVHSLREQKLEQFKYPRKSVWMCWNLVGKRACIRPRLGRSCGADFR